MLELASLSSLLDESVARYSTRPALTLGGADLNYHDLRQAVERLARRLAAANIGHGQRVAILAPNVPALVVGLFAAWRLDAVAVPLSARWRQYELERTLHDAEPSAIISVSSHQGYPFQTLLAQLAPSLPTLRCSLFVDSFGAVTEALEGPASERAEPLGAEICLILYTSGTTGDPKGALITKHAEVHGALELNALLGATPADACIFVIPITHAFGLMCLVAALAAGSRAVLVESTFSSEPTVDAIRRHEATILHGSPALFVSLIKGAPEALRGVRTGFVAGASCPAEVIERLDTIGPRILNLYGMTELGAAACVRPDAPASVRFSTAGRPLPGFSFRIASERQGEIEVRGPFVTPGYFRQPEQTAGAFHDGWFRTGDLGALDRQGNLRISGRAKDVIQVGGLNVFPAEVESLLLTHSGVAQAAVIGVPHPSLGEALQAFVVPRPGADITAPALLQFARSRIAGYKLPYAIRILPELPLLSSGKPDRVALRRFQAEP